MTINTERVRKGSCLCGGISFEITGPLRNIVNCYCDQCRKTSGNYVAASSCKRNQLSFVTQESLTWYQSSKNARRGFCASCGGNVLIEFEKYDTYSIPAGILGQPTGLQTIAEIHTAQKPDYLEHSEPIKSAERSFTDKETWKEIYGNTN